MKTGTLSSMGMVLVLLMLLALATPIAAAVGRDVFVGPGREYETIQAAVDAASQGSRILVYPRIGQDPERYEESVTVTTNNLQIIAQDENVVVSPPEGQPGFDVKADHVTVQGFEISGNEWQNNVVGQPYGSRLYLPFAASVVGLPLRDYGWAIGARVDGVPVIVHTADGGLSWQAQGDLTGLKGSAPNDISAVDHVTAWAALGSADEVAGGAILHTTDGGTTWASQPIPPDLEGGVKSIKGLSRKHAWAASLRGTILHTTDGGATWNVVPHPGVPIYQVNRMDAKGKNVWIADAWVDQSDPIGALVHTQDGGLSWQAERLPDDSPLTVHAFNTEAVWASGSWLAKNPAFYRTLDGGLQWDHVIQLGLNDHLDDICAASRDDVWGVTNQGNIWRIHVAPDGTPEKHLITPLKELGRHMPEGITCLDASTAWAVAMGIPGTTDELGVILHTTDGGKKWVKQPAPTDVQYWKVSFAGAKR